MIAFGSGPWSVPSAATTLDTPRKPDGPSNIGSGMVLALPQPTSMRQASIAATAPTRMRRRIKTVARLLSANLDRLLVSRFSENIDRAFLYKPCSANHSAPLQYCKTILSALKIASDAASRSTCTGYQYSSYRSNPAATTLFLINHAVSVSIRNHLSLSVFCITPLLPKLWEKGLGVRVNCGVFCQLTDHK